jgi:hypothetical protein
MSDLTLSPLYDDNRRWRFDWVLPALFQPRRAFAKITSAETAVWQTPIAILAITALVRTLVAGGIRQAAAAQGQITLPPGWEYYTPEQQAQFQQAMTATSGPVFTYLLPAIMAVLGIYLSWLVLGWLLHLLLTLFGGRGSSQQALNVVAWATLPYAIREVIRIVGMWNSGQLLTNLGLSGFAPAGEGTMALLLLAILTLVDIYLLWQILLLALGARLIANISRPKVWLSVLISVLILLVLRVVPALLGAQFSNLTVIRPFF